MLELLEDDAQRFIFKQGTDLRIEGPPDRLDQFVVDWSVGDKKPITQRLQKVHQLASRPKSDVRLIFTEPDVSRPHNYQALLHLFNLLSVPTDFIRERNEGSPSSCSYRYLGKGQHCAWAHFLSKHISIDGRGRIIGNRGVQHDEDNWVWQQWAFFLTWSDTQNSNSEGRDDNDTDLRAEGKTPTRFRNVTLCCWGGDSMGGLQRRIKKTAQAFGLSEALGNPFILFDAIFDELAHAVNETNRRLRTHIIYHIEDPTLTSAKNALQSSSFNFVSQFNVMKHVIHLRETCDAAQSVMAELGRLHEKYFQRYPYVNQDECQSLVYGVTDGIEHKRGLVRSFDMQAASLEKRVQKLTDLALNTVAQKNSVAVIDDSRSMFTISVVTLVFLPFASVAAMFGMPFFYPNDQAILVVTSNFWVFWITVIPLTMIVLLVWGVISIITRERIRPLDPASMTIFPRPKSGADLSSVQALRQWWLRHRRPKTPQAPATSYAEGDKLLQETTSGQAIQRILTADVEKPEVLTNRQSSSQAHASDIKPTKRRAQTAPASSIAEKPKS